MKLSRILYAIVLAVALVKREALATSQGTGDERIFGGVEVPLGDAPFQVSFQDRGRHFCGGSIIDPNLIVTAAHCCDYAKQSDSLKIAAGLNNLRKPEDGFQTIAVAGIVVHPDYGEDVLSSDICILQLKESLILSAERRTARINLPPTGYTASGIANVTGWGETSNITRPDRLMRVTVPIVTDHVCRENYSQGAILDEMICAGGEGGKGACYGDSGSPLVDSNGFMVGVASWGYPECGTAGYPGVYAEVSYFTEWIENVLVNSTREVQVSS